MTDSYGPQSPALPPALRERWRQESVESVWLRPSDWYHPAVDALAEALLAGADPVPAALRLGDARGLDGVGLTESIDDLACLYRSVGVGEPPLSVIRALGEGWAGAQAAPLTPTACVDAESGLPTAEYLAVRLAEAYGAAARSGVPLGRSHCLVMLDVVAAELSPWTRMARSAGVGAALSTVFGDGHPMAAIDGGVYTVLAPRDDALGQAIARVRAEVTAQCEELEVGDLVRRPVRVWVEPLPGTHAQAVRLLADAARL